MHIISIIGGLILALILHQNVASILKMTNAVCESKNKSWVTVDLCRLRAIRRNKTVLNVKINILHPSNDIHCRVQVLKKASGYKPWLFDYTTDACAFMKRQNHPVLKVIYNLYRNYSNINHTCPYVGLQQVKDFYLPPEKLPVPFPTGDYALFVTWIMLGKPQLVTNVYFEYKEDLIKQ